MLSFFTDPYPDELLLSAVSRYHYYSGNNDYRITNLELYGKESIDSRDNALNYLVNNLDGSYNQKELLYNHTLFPFYSFFSDFVGFNEYMCINKQLFYCPECTKEDLEKYGEAYFHREHQIRDILICPKHRVVLKPYGIGQFWKNINNYKKFEIRNVDLNYGQVLDESKYDKLWQISKLVYQILSNGINRYTNEYVLYNYYKKLLHEKGFVNCYGDINESNLEEEMINFYGDDILSILDLGYKTNKFIYWRINSFNEFYRPHDPMRHLMLINLLGKNIIDVINDIDKDYKPFGEGPWKCINAVCCFQDIAVIKKVEYISENNTEAPYGIFECEYCGLKYSRYLNNEYNCISHITTSGERYLIKEILDYGQLWYESLRNYIINDNYSVTKISKIMKCNCNVVKDHAQKLNSEGFI